MNAAREAAAVPRVNLGAELRAAAELWALPALLALLPYRLGIAAARLASRALPLYAEAARAGLAQWREATGGGDERAWIAGWRFAQLVDHMDLFWTLTRSRAFLLRRVGATLPALSAGRSVLVLSFHFGQGLWLMPWLAAQGIVARFVSVRLAREHAASALGYAYAKLRIRMVERLAGIGPIYTGGARREIAATLARGGAVYGLVDVPVPASASAPANATLLGRAVLLPTGLLDAAQGAQPHVLVVTSHTGGDGARVVEAEWLGPAGEVTIGGLAAMLERRLREAPAAWHFWHLWPQFQGRAR